MPGKYAVILCDREERVGIPRSCACNKGTGQPNFGVLIICCSRPNLSMTHSMN